MKPTTYCCYYYYYYYYYYYFPHYHHYDYHNFGFHTQVVCLLQFGFTTKLLELYIEVATDNHNSQKELRTTVGEGASTKRARVEADMLKIYATDAPNSDILWTALETV